VEKAGFAEKAPNSLFTTLGYINLSLKDGGYKNVKMINITESQNLIKRRR